MKNIANLSTLNRSWFLGGIIHRTILDEFYRVTFRKNLYESIEQLQNDLDIWMDYYNNERTHQEKRCKGKTPMQTLLDGKQIWMEKFANQI